MVDMVSPQEVSIAEEVVAAMLREETSGPYGDQNRRCRWSEGAMLPTTVTQFSSNDDMLRRRNKRFSRVHEVPIPFFVIHKPYICCCAQQIVSRIR